MMLLVVLCGLGWGSYQLMSGVGAHVSEYVIASGANLDALVKAQVEGTRAHAALQDALANVLGSTVATRDAVVVNGEKLAELSRMLKETSDLLRSSPINQQEQMDALSRIEKALAELTLVMKSAPRLPPEKPKSAP